MKHITTHKMIHLRFGNPNRAALIFFLSLMWVLASSCNLPGVPRADQDLVATSVAGTVIAQGDERGDPTEKAAPVTLTPVSTDTPAPTDTATPPPTATFTPTPDVLGVHVSNDTFCRLGTGSSYEALGILNANQTSEIHALDPTGNYWYISNPDGEGMCWVWGRYATPEGPTDSLPVYTPPPKPEFVIRYDILDVAAGSSWIWFTIENVGSLPLDSITTTVKAKYPDQDEPGVVHNQSSTVTENYFYQTRSLDSKVGKAAPGVTVYWHSGRLRTPFGQASVEVTICSKNDLKGTCSTQVYTFKVTS